MRYRRLLAVLIIVMGMVSNMEGKNRQDEKKLEKATFAGGCFWCMIPPFENLEGVVQVTAGYTGGDTEDPDYDEVCSDTTGHVEAVQVIFDPSVVSYDELLEVFWKQIDPTDAGGQFADRGTQYRTAIFYHSGEQKAMALKSRERLDTSGRFKTPVVTAIEEAGKFYRAEDYHQDYHKTNTVRYKMYRGGSGRDRFILKHWEK